MLQGSRGEERKRTEEMLGRLTFPDWLVVKHLGECMEKDNFADLINMMANNLDDVDVDEEKVGDISREACLASFLLSGQQ